MSTNDCACLYGGCDDSNDFEDDSYVKARKPHICCECRAAIVPGTRYHRFSAKSDGKIFTKTTCALCAELRETFYCDGYYFGRLWQDIREQMFEQTGLTSACLEKLATVEAKQFLQQRWWSWVETQNG